MKEEQDLQLGQVMGQIKTTIESFDSVIHGERKIPGNRIDLFAYFCFKTIRELCNRMEISCKDEIYDYALDEYIKNFLLTDFFKQAKIEDYLEQMLKMSERSNECQEPTS